MLQDWHRKTISEVLSYSSEFLKKAEDCLAQSPVPIRELKKLPREGLTPEDAVTLYRQILCAFSVCGSQTLEVPQEG